MHVLGMTFYSNSCASMTNGLGKIFPSSKLQRFQDHSVVCDSAKQTRGKSNVTDTPHSPKSCDSTCSNLLHSLCNFEFPRGFRYGKNQNWAQQNCSPGLDCLRPQAAICSGFDLPFFKSRRCLELTRASFVIPVLSGMEADEDSISMAESLFVVGLDRLPAAPVSNGARRTSSRCRRRNAVFEAERQAAIHVLHVARSHRSGGVLPKDVLSGRSDQSAPRRELPGRLGHHGRHPSGAWQHQSWRN